MMKTPLLSSSCKAPLVTPEAQASRSRRSTRAERVRSGNTLVLPRALIYLQHLCRCFGAPARRVFPDHLITARLVVRWKRPPPRAFVPRGALPRLDFSTGSSTEQWTRHRTTSRPSRRAALSPSSSWPPRSLQPLRTGSIPGPLCQRMRRMRRWISCGTGRRLPLPPTWRHSCATASATRSELRTCSSPRARIHARRRSSPRRSSGSRYSSK